MDRTLKLPGTATLRGTGTVFGWRARIACAWRVLVYGKVVFNIATEELVISREADHD